ncbi:DUF892 family protein [Williamsia sp. M5A3_1d]
MTVSTSTISGQLRAILALTHTEIQVAQTRIAQARTDAVRRELTQNAENARGRAESIQQVLRDQGASRTALRPLLGRLGALGKALAEQVAPLDEALLGDLALEHQLLDRSRYLVALATSAGDETVVELGKRLITAHQATVEWLTTVLAEEALGGPVALRRGPGQWGAGLAVRVASAPASVAVGGMDRVVEILRGASEAVSAVRGRGGPIGDRLPIDGYDDLTVARVVAAIKELDEPTSIRAVVAYEEAHKNRHGVVSAAQTRLAAIAAEIVGIR